MAPFERSSWILTRLDVLAIQHLKRDRVATNMTCLWETTTTSNKVKRKIMPYLWRSAELGLIRRRITKEKEIWQNSTKTYLWRFPGESLTLSTWDNRTWKRNPIELVLPCMIKILQLQQQRRNCRRFALSTLSRAKLKTCQPIKLILIFTELKILRWELVNPTFFIRDSVSKSILLKW